MYGHTYIHTFYRTEKSVCQWSSAWSICMRIRTIYTSKHKKKNWEVHSCKQIKANINVYECAGLGCTTNTPWHCTVLKVLTELSECVVVCYWSRPSDQNVFQIGQIVSCATTARKKLSQTFNTITIDMYSSNESILYSWYCMFGWSPTKKQLWLILTKPCTQMVA